MRTLSPKAVIFDMDGTLIDTERLNMAFWKRAAAGFGFEVTTEEILHIRSLDGRLVKEFMESRHPGMVLEDVRAERRRLMDEHVAAHGVDLKPGVGTIMDRLESLGVKTAVATASRPDHATAWLSSAGILDRFDEVVCTSSVPRGKPEPDVYLYACERVGEAPCDCLAVEDAPNGVRSAHAAGCRVAFVPDLTDADDEIRSMAEVFRDLGELSRSIVRRRYLLSKILLVFFSDLGRYPTGTALGMTVTPIRDLMVSTSCLSKASRRSSGSGVSK